MSQRIINKSCEICGRIEVGLVEMNVGKTKHYLCYPCMANFATDVLDYARMNLTKKVNECGNTYFIDEKNKSTVKLRFISFGRKDKRNENKKRY